MVPPGRHDTATDANRRTAAPDADPDELATGLIAALQGVYVRAQASRNVDHMATEIEMALAGLMTGAALATQLPIDSLRTATSAGVRGDVVALVFSEVDVGGARGFSGGQEGGEAPPERRCGGQVRR
jgi:hypothetical protein